MSSMELKKKKEELSPTLTLMSLPDDLLLNCFARVSRLYYPSLSLVSKTFQSLLVSPELYKVRSLLGNTERCLYLCMNFYSPEPSWFTLCPKPDKKTLTRSSGYVLAKVPILSSPPIVSGLAAERDNFYSIHGSGSWSKSSSVKVFHSKSLKWRHEVVASFPLELWSLSDSVLNRKIYVAVCHDDEIGDSFLQCNKSIAIDEKLKTRRDQVIAYDSRKGQWDMVQTQIGRFLEDNSCVIEKVLYRASCRKLMWYDTKAIKWRNLEGLVELPEFPPTGSIRLIEHGGKMVVLWDEDSSSGIYKKMIWCAEISLEKRNQSGEIWGKVEWCDNVVTVNKFCYITKILATIA